MVLVVALLALPRFVPQAVLERLGTIGASIGGGSYGGRGALWREAVELLARYPVAGIGVGALASRIGAVAHNTFISVAAETGVIGFVLFVSVLAVALAQVARLPMKKLRTVARYLCHMGNRRVVTDLGVSKT